MSDGLHSRALMLLAAITLFATCSLVNAQALSGAQPSTASQQQVEQSHFPPAGFAFFFEQQQVGKKKQFVRSKNIQGFLWRDVPHTSGRFPDA